MCKENGFTPQEAVTNAVAEIVRPWTESRIPSSPHVQVIEVARITGLSPNAIVTMVYDEPLGLLLKSSDGTSVNGNLRRAAINSAPGKLLGRLTGGNRSLEDLSFELGLPKLQLQLFSQ